MNTIQKWILKGRGDCIVVVGELSFNEYDPEVDTESCPPCAARSSLPICFNEYDPEVDTES